GFRATVCDINTDMLDVGRNRAAARHLDQQVSFVEGNAETLAFGDNSFDAYTIAFGIRNVPRIDAALREAYRVLRPGSRFLCLEFSTVDVPGLDRLYDFFSFKVIPPLGRAVTGDAESYQYLVESIRKFPRPNAFAEMIREAGFSRVKWESLSGGIVALHSGWRLGFLRRPTWRGWWGPITCLRAKTCSASWTQVSCRHPGRSRCGLSW